MKKTVAVIGSRGAIGNAVVDTLLADESVEAVFKFSRAKNTEHDDKVKHIFIDIEDEESIKQATESLPEDTKFDLIFVATGILHDEKNVFPEKSIKDISFDKLIKVLTINTIGPTLVGKYFIPYLRKDSKSTFAFLSARVGSISDNRLGGWYAYRASKAALNMIIKTSAIELKRTHRDALIVGLHPGTVDSHLSSPFQKNVPESKLFTAEYSVEQLLTTLQKLTPEQSGLCYAWDGQEVLP